MQIRQLIAIALVTLFTSAVLADECTETCESNYRACKNVAESTTAKSACEDKLKQCKVSCR